MASSVYCDPVFFSIFQPDLCSNYFHIPSAFKSNLEMDNRGEARTTATITRLGTNQEWKVDLVKHEDGEFYFIKGWEKFVQDNNMSIYEFMVFNYHGDSNFTVRIYGRHGCLKEDVEEIAEVEFEEDDYDDDDEEEAEYLMICGFLKRPRVGRPSLEDPKSEAVKAAKFYMKIHGEYPSFRVAIALGYVKRHLLNVPLQFVDAYMIGSDKRNVTLQVRDKTWTVKMLVYRYSSSPNCKLSKGITKFARENNIDEGDVCVFELVKRDTFRVSIFPC